MNNENISVKGIDTVYGKYTSDGEILDLKDKKQDRTACYHLSLTLYLRFLVNAVRQRKSKN
jgi:hypothetical protein